MVVDSQGRAYVGEFGFDLQAFADPAPAKLMRIDPDGAVTVLADDLLFPNGSVITPNGDTLDRRGDRRLALYRIHARRRRLG